MPDKIDISTFLPEPQLTYTVRSFCDATGLSSTHVWDAISKQLLGTVKVRGRRLIPGKMGHAYLVELLASGKYQGPVPMCGNEQKTEEQALVASKMGAQR